MSRFHFGLVWDHYSPAVEAQIVRDVIAMQNFGGNRPLELICCCEASNADPVLRSFSIKRIPTTGLATMWIGYSTTLDEEVEFPEHAKVVIKRDLAIQQSEPYLRDIERPGYYLPEPGRIGPDSLSIHKPAPNGYGFVDPAIVLLWG